MIQSSLRYSLIHSCCAVALIFGTAPAHAAADATQTGIIAGIGLSAASGKTTATNGAGAIEAGILSSDAYNQAGAIIAAIVGPMAGTKTIILLAHDDSTNFNQPDVVLGRIDTMIRTYVALTRSKICSAPAKASAPKAEATTHWDLMQELFPGLGSITAKDVVGAGLVDTTISPITLTPSDRMLMDAILMYSGPGSVTGPIGWTTDFPAAPASGTGPVTGIPAKHLAFVVPGEATAVRLSAKSTVYSHYQAMLEAEDAMRAKGCDADQVKAAFTATDALVTSLNTAGDKGALSPLLNAIQLEQVRGTDPLVLRVSVDQAGGTLLTRTGIIYSLGFPGAAVVSAGLLVSFRLADPATGQLEAIGAVRCITAPMRIRGARDAVENKPRPGNQMACSYKVSKA